MKSLRITVITLYTFAACQRQKKQRSSKLDAAFFCTLAEREGFEPPEPLSSTVFKTAVIDHSTTSPNMQ